MSELDKQLAEDLAEVERIESGQVKKRHKESKVRVRERVRKCRALKVETAEKEFQNKTIQDFWQANRATLTAGEPASREALQTEYLLLARMMAGTIEGLAVGLPVGTPDGLPYPDCLLEEVWEHIGHHGLAFTRPSLEDLKEAYRKSNEYILTEFISWDESFAKYGYETRLTQQLYNKFVDAASKYFQEHPDGDIDWSVANKAIKEYEARQPRKPLIHTPITDENIKSHNNRVALTKLQKEIADEQLRRLNSEI